MFVGSLDGFLHALDLETGKPVWTFEAKAEVKSSPSVRAVVLTAATSEPPPASLTPRQAT